MSLLAIMRTAPTPRVRSSFITLIQSLAPSVYGVAVSPDLISRAPINTALKPA